MDIFIARQGIYDIKGNVVAYELLYRDSLKNSFNQLIEENEATYSVIQNISSFGLEALTNNRRAFVNFPEALIKENIATLLPKEKVVIEILESVNPTIEVINNLLFLKNLGYYIALDDVDNYENIVKFIDVVDIVKVDFSLASKYEREKIAIFCKRNNIDLLAEKIETKEDLEEAKEEGYKYFQGYYYSRPSVFLGKDIAVKNTSVFMLLVELVKDDFDIDRVEDIMKNDIALTYKFLRFINSSYFSFLQEVKSIKQAIMLIGKEELKKWLSILSFVTMSSENDEYAKNTIIRARLCEEIAREINCKDESAAFMVGLFYNIHMMIEKDINYVVDTLPLNIEIKNAILGKDNMFKDILDLVIAYENIDKKEIILLCNKLGINKGKLLELYYESINWSSKISD